jgi:ubiquinone/menaquinone biosynthesis C-methylase UbiE
LHERFRPALVRLRDRAAVLAGASELFRNKYAKLADPGSGAQILNLFRYQLALAGIDPSGKAVLDAGCGSGIFSILFHLLGASRVEALDLYPWNIDSLSALAREFELPIRAQLRDVCATGLDSASADVVYCTEAISHFHDWQAFVAESARVLQSGGRILISDWNNGANPLVKRRTYRSWLRSETGPFNTELFEPDKPLPYLYRRWMILRREFPQLTEEQIFHLGMRTAGEGGDELLAAGSKFVETCRFPDGGYRWGESQHRPEDDQRNEEPVDPREVVTRLRAHAVRARAYPHFGYNRSTLLGPINQAAALLSGIALRLSPCYLVTGVRIVRIEA